MHERGIHALVERRRNLERPLTQPSEPDIPDTIRRNNLLIAEAAILFASLSACVGSNLLVGYLALNMKLSTLRLQVDKDLVGLTGQNYNGWDCHIGIHPRLISKELHISCVGKKKANQNYYLSILPIP